MLEHLFAIAEAKSKDHILDLDTLVKETNEITRKKTVLEGRVKEQTLKRNMTKEEKDGVLKELEELTAEREKAEKAHKTISASLAEATKKVNEALAAAKATHELVLTSKNKSSLLSIALKKEHERRKKQKCTGQIQCSTEG